jgi:hypothetical protein
MISDTDKQQQGCAAVGASAHPWFAHRQVQWAILGSNQ